MRQLIILFILFLFCCKNSNSQKESDPSFQNYASKFTQLQLPLNISTAHAISWESIKKISADYISEIEINKFICTNSTCKCDNTKFLYSYWFKAPIKNNAFLLAMVSLDNENEEDDNVDYGLNQYIFTTYNFEGKILSQITIGKIRDNFLPNFSSTVKVSTDTLYSQVIGPYTLDYTKQTDKTTCKMEEDYYFIDSNGIFQKLEEKSKNKIIEILWDKTNREVTY